ncbi:MAG: helix-turn-helix transcriptional regulator [Symploca sp. SIO1C2]|nr:helix-turn-helix transcriptional regulator [Symploca sp. SIO2C1]NER25661.1 helix-turn-helix transcriptional regulator [Symploca sp. SIO1C2]
MDVVREIVVSAPGLGEKIKKAREKDTRSVQVLATLAQISTAYWYFIEQEKRSSITEENLRNIEKVLGVNFGVKFPD